MKTDQELDDFSKWLLAGQEKKQRVRRQGRGESEHDLQSAFFQWVRGKRIDPAYPQLWNIFAVPNGGKRDGRTAQLMYLEGVEAGVPDTFCMVPARGYHGLAIEHKVTYADGSKNDLSEDQARWFHQLMDNGYLYVTSYSWVTSARIVAVYLQYEDLLSELED